MRRQQLLDRHLNQVRHSRVTHHSQQFQSAALVCGDRDL